MWVMLCLSPQPHTESVYQETMTPLALSTEAVLVLLGGEFSSVTPLKPPSFLLSPWPTLHPSLALVRWKWIPKEFEEEEKNVINDLNKLPMCPFQKFCTQCASWSDDSSLTLLTYWLGDWHLDSTVAFAEPRHREMNGMTWETGNVQRIYHKCAAWPLKGKPCALRELIITFTEALRIVEKGRHKEPRIVVGTDSIGMSF